MGTGAAPFSYDEAWLKANFPDLDRFQLKGQGGQKLVFSATHVTEGQVVLKIFQPNQTLEEVKREILAVQQVQSAHVPAIRDYGSVTTPIGPCFWFREQLVEGQTLRERLQAGPVTPTEVLRLGKDMLDALVKAEQVNIVHRDVKPDNIIIDPQGKYWLLDFGLARHLTLASQTPTGHPFGKMTPGYAPPEQARNDKPNIDARADLFGLGITLFECATGSNPLRHGARDLPEVLRRTETMALPPLNLAIQDAASFRDLVAAITQKRRDHRPTTAAEAATWMNEICAKNGI